MKGETFRIDPKPCSCCGKTCRTKSGMCRACTNGQRMPDPRTLNEDQLASFAKACMDELKRRKEVIDAALARAA